MKAFGERLREAREAKSISLGMVAASTRIRERYLKALERSDLDALPGGVFDKGYIKSYAQFLDIEAEPLLESYADEAQRRGVGTAEAERAKLEELARLVPARLPARTRDRGWVRVAAVVAIVSVAGAVAWWIFDVEGGPDPAPRADEPKTLTRSLVMTPAPSASPRAAVEASEEPDDSVGDRSERALSVPQLGVGTGIVDRALVGTNDRFPDGTSVWFWTRIVGGAEGDRVRHVWRHDGRVYMDARLRVGGSHWRTYSTLELPPGSVGEWTVEVRTEDDTVLASETFAVFTGSSARSGFSGSMRARSSLRLRSASARLDEARRAKSVGSSCRRPTGGRAPSGRCRLPWFLAQPA